MNFTACCRWLRRSAIALALLIGGATVAIAYDASQPHGAWVPTTIEELECLDACQLEDLYRRTEVGRPLAGVSDGRLLCLTDGKRPKLKLRMSRVLWRGKGACEDGYFSNRWIGGVSLIDSHYVVGPSWLDGKPAILMDYAPKTPILGNVHDELREVSPGLYFGPVYEVCPCPKLVGWVAVKVRPCQTYKRCKEGCCSVNWDGPAPVTAAPAPAPPASPHAPQPAPHPVPGQ